MLEGLPTGAFDHFLLFVGSGNRRRHGFPSYSWAGWIGKIAFPWSPPTQLNRWLRDQTWVIWYKWNSNGALNLVWNQKANPSFPVWNEEFVGYRQRSRFCCPSPQLDTSQIVPTGKPAVLVSPLPPYPLLRFYSMVVYLKIRLVGVMVARA